MVASSTYSAIPSTTSTSTPAGSAGESERPYLGKCQYKTGKCFNERTLKRNGDAHSLCEEHRVKQNLIQRRSDRKYQTVHAIRRRERSQRRAALKKQASMEMAQQLFYEHQQQQQQQQHQQSSLEQLDTVDPFPLPGALAPVSTHSLHSHRHPSPPSLHALQHHRHSTFSSHNGHSLNHPLNPVAALAPPIQIPDKLDLSHFVSTDPRLPPSSGEGLASPILSFASAARSFGAEVSKRDNDMENDADCDENDEEVAGNEERELLQQRRKKQLHQQRVMSARSAASPSAVKDENSSSPTGIDDFAPDSFLSICASDDESDAAYADLMPLLSSMGEKRMWTEDDIEFLQSVLLM